jgi:hypothetical protein
MDAKHLAFLSEQKRRIKFRYIFWGCWNLVENPAQRKNKMVKRKATAADADICMKLYDLRREPEMRKARNFVNFQFQPKNIDDIINLTQALGTQENAWARQVLSFWENAAALVLNDVVHPGLFFAWNGEMVFVYAKLKPFLKELREKTDNPAFLAGVEKVVNSSSETRKRVDMIQKRMAKMAAKAQAAKSK